MLLHVAKLIYVPTLPAVAMSEAKTSQRMTEEARRTKKKIAGERRRRRTSECEV